MCAASVSTADSGAPARVRCRCSVAGRGPGPAGAMQNGRPPRGPRARPADPASGAGPPGAASPGLREQVRLHRRAAARSQGGWFIVPAPGGCKGRSAERRFRGTSGGGRLFLLPGKSRSGQAKGVVPAPARRRDKNRAGSSKDRAAPSVHAQDPTPFVEAIVPSAVLTHLVSPVL